LNNKYGNQELMTITQQ